MHVYHDSLCIHLLMEYVNLTKPLSNKIRVTAALGLMFEEWPFENTIVDLLNQYNIV